MVWEVTRKVSIPVIGVGGIMNVSDALEFLIVGARAVQVGTANFVNPHGLHDENHYTTANDLGKLAYYAINVPHFLESCAFCGTLVALFLQLGITFPY